jgi:hypothetical protein
VARRQQGVAGDLEGVTGKVPGKGERAGAHRNGGSMVRQEESSGTAALAGGEGAPVVVVKCDEVLQLEKGKGVRKLQKNYEDWRLGKELTGEWRMVAVLGQNSSEGGASGGRRRWCGRGERWGEVWRSIGGPERSG